MWKLRRLIVWSFSCYCCCTLWYLRKPVKLSRLIRSVLCLVVKWWNTRRLAHHFFLWYPESILRSFISILKVAQESQLVHRYLIPQRSTEGQSHNRTRTSSRSEWCTARPSSGTRPSAGTRTARTSLPASTRLRWSTRPLSSSCWPHPSRWGGRSFDDLLIME